MKESFNSCSPIRFPDAIPTVNKENPVTPRLRTRTRIVTVLCAVLGTCAVARAQTAVDSFNPNADLTVKALAVQSDGRIVLGGDFFTLAGGATLDTVRNNIARVNADGSLDTSFRPGADNGVYALALQPDGKILAGGFFTKLGGGGPYNEGTMLRSKIGRLNADGSPDTSFNPGASGTSSPTVYTIVVQPDGKILVGGSFTTLAGAARNRIGRLNADGSIDGTFNPGASTTVWALALQPDGKILVGTAFSFTPTTTLRRLNADGSVDSTFDVGTPGGGTVNAIAVQPDGKILVGGSFITLSGAEGAPVLNNIARINADGSLDTSFNSGSDFYLNTVLLQPDGKIIVGGAIILGGQAGQVSMLGGGGPGTTTRRAIGRLNADGSLDTAFDSGSNGEVYVLAAQPGGKVLVGGSFTKMGGGGTGTTTRNNIARLDISVGGGVSGSTSSEFSVNDRGAASQMTTGTAATVTVGYARIQPNTGGTTPSGVAIFGARTNGVLVSETGVPATPALLSARIYAEVAGPVNTGVAMANPNNTTATITFFFTDAAGADLGSGSTTIPANGQIAKFLSESPFKTFAGTTFQGTFSFTSSVPLGVVALRSYINEYSDFLMSTLPVINTSVAASTGTMVLPHFADGGGWITQILLVNPTDTAMTGSVQFTNDNGTATNVTIASQTNSTFSYSVPRRSSYKLATLGSGQATTVGAVRIVPAGDGAAPTPLAVFSFGPLGVIVSEAGVPTLSGVAFRMYAESSGTAGAAGNIQTGIAVANNTTLAANVTFELTNLDGSTTGLSAPVTVSVPASGHTGKFLAQIFSSVPNPFQGVLRISTTSSGVSVVGLRTRYNERTSAENFLITTTPPTLETAVPTTAESLFPDLADGGGYTTQFILFSGVAGQSSSGTLRFYAQNGQELSLPVR